jgi:hypothetical protein
MHRRRWEGQLLAVLAVLREIKTQSLRLSDAISGLSLVAQEQEKLLESSLATLFGRLKRLFEMAEEFYATTRITIWLGSSFSLSGWHGNVA